MLRPDDLAAHPRAGIANAGAEPGKLLGSAGGGSSRSPGLRAAVDLVGALYGSWNLGPGRFQRAGDFRFHALLRGLPADLRYNQQ